jgi:hypothetical protein
MTHDSTVRSETDLSRRLCVCVVSRQSAQGRFLSFALRRSGTAATCHPLGVPALAFRAQPASGRLVLSPVI